MDGGWKANHAMKPFADSLAEECMAGTRPDPTSGDPSAPQTQIQLRLFQERKANAFFKAAFESLEKHYKRYGEEMFFLSLYDEPHITKIVAGLLLGKEAQLQHAIQPATVPSQAHGMDINLQSFLEFAKKKINVQQQMETVFVKECEDILPLLLGK